MRKTLTTFALTTAAMAALTLGAGAASAEENIVDTEIRPVAGPCSDLPNAFVEPGGRVGVDLTIKCFE